MPVVTKNLTILFTDIKGFTDKTSNRSRVDISRLINDYHAVVLPVLQSHGGKLVKTIGDAFLMLFDSPTDAVLAGVSAQEALLKRNTGLEDSERIDIRVAINSGEVNIVQDDVYGEAVNIAARIEGVAEAGEVYFTEAVYLAMNKTEVPSSEVGLLQLKGIPEKVRVYKVRRETPLGVGQVPPRPAPRTAASEFIPGGEKAKFVTSAAAPAPQAILTGSASRWKRLWAVSLDFMICTSLLGALAGNPASMLVDIVKVPQGAKQVKIAPGTLSIKAGDTRIMVDKKGKTTIVDTSDEERPEDWSHRISSALMPLAWVLYNFAFVAFWGATPGKKVLKLKVVSETGAPVDQKHSAARALMSLASGPLSLLIGYAWGFFDKQGRTWHDHAASTRVVSL